MMDDNRFDELIRDLPRSFNAPPEPPLDEMWTTIEDAHFNAPVPISTRRGLTSRAPWLAAAAAMVGGVGIGRYIPSGATPAENALSPSAIAANRRSWGR